LKYIQIKILAAGGSVGNSSSNATCKHSLYADKFTRLFYLLIQLVRAANYGCWCRWWLQSDPDMHAYFYTEFSKPDQTEVDGLADDDDYWIELPAAVLVAL